jgi:hypothetical protein
MKFYVQFSLALYVFGSAFSILKRTFSLLKRDLSFFFLDVWKTANVIKLIVEIDPNSRFFKATNWSFCGNSKRFELFYFFERCIFLYYPPLLVSLCCCVVLWLRFCFRLKKERSWALLLTRWFILLFFKKIFFYEIY